MNDVNLLPQPRRERVAQRRRIRLWIGAGVAWCGLLAGAHAILVGSRGLPDELPVRREIDDLTGEQRRLDEEIKRLERSVEQDRRSLAAARATVDHPDWSLLLARIVSERDASIVFRRWSLGKVEGRGLSLRLEGDVPQLATLTDFVLRLERFGVFRKVVLANARANPNGPQGESGTAGIEFTIDAELLAATAERRP